ncbi:MAG TPA: LPS assembly lipoprotein LptE [Thermodesulfobacteriota bacterium]
MQRNRSRRTRGPRALASAAALAAALLTGACNYGFSGGGGFPPSIRTLYIEAPENETDRVDLSDQLLTEMNQKLPRSLGVRPGTRDGADAVVRTKILRYDDSAGNYRTDNAVNPGAVKVIQNQVNISMSVQIIDRKRNEILWESSSLSGQGQYNPDKESDRDGRRLAIERLVQAVIDGAQSQW